MGSVVRTSDALRSTPPSSANQLGPGMNTNSPPGSVSKNSVPAGNLSGTGQDVMSSTSVGGVSQPGMKAEATKLRTSRDPDQHSENARHQGDRAPVIRGDSHRQDRPAAGHVRQDAVEVDLCVSEGRVRVSPVDRRQLVKLFHRDRRSEEDGLGRREVVRVAIRPDQDRLRFVRRLEHGVRFNVKRLPTCSK